MIRLELGNVPIMSLQEIETAIQSLPLENVKKLREWIAEYEAEAWDRQIAEDIRAGRLDRFADEALAELDRGECRPLP
jgi:hypothetical protein